MVGELVGLATSPNPIWCSWLRLFPPANASANVTQVQKAAIPRRDDVRKQEPRRCNKSAARSGLFSGRQPQWVPSRKTPSEPSTCFRVGVRLPPKDQSA